MVIGVINGRRSAVNGVMRGQGVYGWCVYAVAPWRDWWRNGLIAGTYGGG